MRRSYWFIFGLLLIGGGLLLFSLFFPHSKSATVNINLQDGPQVRVTAGWTDRAWVMDASRFSLKLVTQSAAGASAAQRFAARLEMGALETTPKGIVEHTVKTNGAATFSWQVRPYTAGVTPGILWLYTVDDNGNETAIFAQEFEFSASDFLGLPPNLFRLLALAALLAAVMIYLFSRRKGHSKKTLAQ